MYTPFKNVVLKIEYHILCIYVVCFVSDIDNIYLFFSIVSGKQVAILTKGIDFAIFS